MVVDAGGVRGIHAQFVNVLLLFYHEFSYNHLIFPFELFLEDLWSLFV